MLAALPLLGADPMEAFPDPAEGMTRWVIQLPGEENEDELKVELIVGKTVEVDAVNRYFFAGRIEAKTVAGWGYTRHQVDQLGPMAGTLMAPPEGAAKEARFVRLGGEPYLIRYNSKLPVVIDVPEGAEVRWRLWQAGEVRKAGQAE